MAVSIILERNVTIEDFKNTIAPFNRNNINIQSGNNTVFDDLVAELNWEYILFECPYREINGECAKFECHHTCKTLHEGTAAFCPTPSVEDELCSLGCNCESDQGQGSIRLMLYSLIEKILFREILINLILKNFYYLKSKNVW